MKYETLIKNIKNRKLWKTIIYIENSDNRAKVFNYLYEFELYIKSHHQNQERFINFKLTYIRNRKELYIIGQTANYIEWKDIEWKDIQL